LFDIRIFLKELRRRNVFKVGVAYGIVAWLLIQIIVAIESPLHLPDWVDTLTIIFLIVGYPVALLFAWAFELTPDGVKRTHKVEPDASITHITGRKFDFYIIGLLLVAVIFLVLDNYVWVDEVLPPSVTTSNKVNIEEKIDASVETDNKSIAVLPFVNMSDDKDYFADGLSEEILNLLAKNRDLKVIGRTSSFAYKGRNEDLRIIGEALGVKNVLEGSVRKSANKLRITAQLIKVEDGSHLWSETYDRELTDVFAIQDDVAAAIIDALQVHIGVGGIAARGQPTQNMEAYSFFLKATALGSNDESPAAVNILLKVTALDPDYAEAFELLAYNYWNQGSNTLDPALNQHLVRGASAKALAINPELVFADALFKTADYENSYIEILKTLEEATGKEPNNPRLITMHLWNLLEMGYAKEALHWAERLKEIEPWAAATYSRLALAQFANGLEKEALASLEVARSRGVPYAALNIASYYLRTGNDDKAIPLMAQINFLPGITDPIEIRTFVMAARNPDTGVAYIEKYLAEISATLSGEEANAFENGIPYLYMDMGHLDKFYEYLNAFDVSTFRWSLVYELIVMAHAGRDLGSTRHPGYLKAVEAMGIMDLWEQHGPPKHCKKIDDKWLCN
jgi:TolB-like protein